MLLVWYVSLVCVSIHVLRHFVWFICRGVLGKLYKINITYCLDSWNNTDCILTYICVLLTNILVFIIIFYFISLYLNRQRWNWLRSRRPPSRLATCVSVHHLLLLTHILVFESLWRFCRYPLLPIYADFLTTSFIIYSFLFLKKFESSECNWMRARWPPSRLATCVSAHHLLLSAYTLGFGENSRSFF